jgi:hypothetical protein
MSDTQVSITFGGQTAEFEAAAAKALAAMKALTDGVTSMTASLSGATQGLHATTPAMAAATQATNATTAAVKNLSPAAKAATVDMRALIDANTGVSSSSRSAAASAETFRQALGDQSNEVKQLRSHFDEATSAAGRTGHASGGVTRELIVLGHEAMTGRFSRFGGSLIVMAELMGNVSFKMLAIGGAIAVAGIAIFHLAEHMHTLQAETAAFNAKMVLMGNPLDEANVAAAGLQRTLQITFGAGEGDARKLSRAVMEIPQSTNVVRAALGELIIGMHETAKTEPLDEFIKKSVAMASTVSGIKRFLTENQLIMDAAQQSQIDGLVASNNLLGAQEMLLARVGPRYGDQLRQQVEAKRARERDDARKSNAMGEVSAMPDQAAQVPIPPLRVSEAAPSPEAQRTNTDIARRNEDEAKLIALLDEKARITKVVAAATDAGARSAAQHALEAVNNEIAEHHARGDTSWLAKQEAALKAENVAIVNGAKTTREANEKRLAHDVSYWGEALKGTTLSITQRAAIQAKFDEAAMQLQMEKLRADTIGNKKGTQERIAELSAQQAADHDNFTRWMALEAEKLAVLKAAHGEKSREYQAELRAEENYQREHAARIQAQDLEALNRSDALGQKAIADKKASLELEVQDRRITKSEELAELQRFAAAEYKIELDRLGQFITTMNQETDAYRKAKDQQLALAARAALVDKQFQVERRTEENRTTQLMLGHFSQVGSAFSSSISGMITKSMSFQQVEQSMAGAVLNSGIKLAETLLTDWIGLTDGKTLATVAGWLGIGAADTAGAAIGAADAAAGALAEIRAYAATAGAAAWASTAAIPVVGPELAPAAAAAAFKGASAFSAAVALPSFAVGAWNLPHDMTARVHAGEMIIPAGPAAAMRAAASGGSASGGGGGDVHLHAHISAIDTRDGAAFLNSQMPFLAGRLKQHLAVNPSAR